MEKITYRRATAADSQILFDLSVSFETFNKEHSTRPHEHFTGDWRPKFAKEIEDIFKRKNAYVYIAFVGDEPAGYVYAYLCENCLVFVIEELFVEPKFKKSGIGGELMNLVIKHGREFDFDIKVEVFDWNTQALEYYLKRGFFLESVVLKLSKFSK